MNLKTLVMEFCAGGFCVYKYDGKYENRIEIKLEDYEEKIDKEKEKYIDIDSKIDDLIKNKNKHKKGFIVDIVYFVICFSVLLGIVLTSFYEPVRTTVFSLLEVDINNLLTFNQPDLWKLLGIYCVVCFILMIANALLYKNKPSLSVFLITIFTGTAIWFLVATLNFLDKPSVKKYNKEKRKLEKKIETINNEKAQLELIKEKAQKIYEDGLKNDNVALIQQAADMGLEIACCAIQVRENLERMEREKEKTTSINVNVNIDNPTEFMNNAIDSYYTKTGIIREPSSASVDYWNPPHIDGTGM